MGGKRSSLLSSHAFVGLDVDGRCILSSDGASKHLSVSMARTADFAANLRPRDWLITNKSEVNFIKDTMTVIVVLKSKYFSRNVEKQELNHLCSAYRFTLRCPTGYSP